MSWLRKIVDSGRDDELEEPAPESSLPEPVEGAAPGLEALFSRMVGPADRSILDLGAASPSSLEVLRRFARKIRFADLRATTSTRGGWESVLEPLPHRSGHPYDVILAWDQLDHLLPEEHERFVRILEELSAEGALLHLVGRGTQGGRTHPYRFTLLDVARIRYEPVGPSRPAHAPILPAEMERLLRSFRVIQGFTLKGGFREYLAKRSG